MMEVIQKNAFYVQSETAALVFYEKFQSLVLLPVA